MYFNLMTCRRTFVTVSSKVLSRSYHIDGIRAIGLASTSGRMTSSLGFIRPRPNDNNLCHPGPRHHSRRYSESSGPGNDAKNNQPSGKNFFVHTNLMKDFRAVQMPNPIYVICSMFASLIIRLFLDEEFSLKAFKRGTKRVLAVVSHELSRGNFNILKNAIVSRSLQEIEFFYNRLSVKQRRDLAVVPEDIFFHCPCETKFVFIKTGDQRRVFVEINVWYLIVKGWGKHRKDLENLKIDFHEPPDSYILVNCRFYREYTKGIRSQWNLNAINYWKSQEYTFNY